MPENNTKKDTIDWKRLWQLVSGIHFETPEAIVRDELLNVTKELQDGILQFRPQQESSVKFEDLLKKRKHEKLQLFTQRVQELLDLDTVQCWDFLCHYLIKEYRGSASLLTTLTSTETNMTKLLDDIWGYYTLQRMIMLQIIKNLLLFHKEPNHPYNIEYKSIIDSIGLDKLRISYIRQLEHLANEKPPQKLVSAGFFNYKAKLVTWSERNCRETIEVLQILLLIIEHSSVDLAELKQLIACFKLFSHSRHNPYFDVAKKTNSELVTRTTYCELALLMKCLDLPTATESEASSSLNLNDTIEAFDNEVSQMYHRNEQGPLLLVWMLLRFRRENFDELEYLARSRAFGKRALDLDCFAFMYQMLRHAIFNDGSHISGIVRRVVFNHLTHMCSLFDGDGSCSRYPYIFELLSEVLSSSALAKEFSTNEDHGLRSLYNSLLETFPLSFESLTMLAVSLTKGGQGKFIKAELESLPIFTEAYDVDLHNLRPTDEEFELMFSYTPFGDIDYNIPEGTTAVVTTNSPDPEPYVHFRAPINYFNILQHNMNLLLQGTSCDDACYRRVELGLEYLQSVLEITTHLSGISDEMVRPAELCINLLAKYKNLRSPPAKVMANCLNVCTALLPLAETEIYTRVTNLKILPEINNLQIKDYKRYASGIYHDPRLPARLIDEVEKASESYEFLQAYIRFLRRYTKLGRSNYAQIEIPGLVFLLRDVFCNLHNWPFKNNVDKHKIFSDILGFICDVLDLAPEAKQSREGLAGDHHLLLRDICVYTLLNMENGMILLRFIGLGNALLQHAMEMESNWIQQQPHTLMSQVRLSMRILMQLLRQRHCVFAKDELSPLESLIYTQPKQRDTLRIIPILTSYMNNIFDRWIPLLSCRLLRRIALEFNMSLLACLDMEPDQIRLTFLEKLPDEYESDALKIAVLEFVDACIEKQPGMTEAFFKVDHSLERRSFFVKEQSVQIADSINTFLEGFLDTLQSKPSMVEHIITSNIMDIFATLWKNNMQKLLDKLLEKPNFWQSLCSPFFYTIRPGRALYTQLLNIVAIEVYCANGKHNDDLKKVLDKFFEKECLTAWLDNVFNVPHHPSRPTAQATPINKKPAWLCRLQAFKDLLLVLLRKQPQFMVLSNQQLEYLLQRCRDTLVAHSVNISDMRPFIILAELYLLLLNTVTLTARTPEAQKLELQSILQLLLNVTSCYEDLHVRAKEACLAIAIKYAQRDANIMATNTETALSFFNAVVCMICIEIHDLELSINCIMASGSIEPAAAKQIYSTNTVVLSLNLLKALAVIVYDDGSVECFAPLVSSRIFQRLLSCTSVILQQKSKQQLTIQLLDVLIVFARSKCSAQLVCNDVSGYLWLRLLPPADLLPSVDDYNKDAPTAQEHMWTVEEWWPIYTRGIQLVTALSNQHSSVFTREMMQFISIHEQFLVDSLLLGKQSLEPKSMELQKAAVMLLLAIAPNHKTWRDDNPQCFLNLKRALQAVMAHSITMFHQPRNLRTLTAGRRLNNTTTFENYNNESLAETVATYNSLTEIIVYCAQIFQHISPDLLDLLCYPSIKWQTVEPVFEIQLGAPKLNENSTSLTFGLALSIVSIYTKVLNLQNRPFNAVLLNDLPATTEANSNKNSVPMQSEPLRGSDQHGHTSRSMSVAPASSTACPSNELLTNLDSELCLSALEHILLLTATHSICSLLISPLEKAEKNMIRREISAELTMFHDFIRRKVLADMREQRIIWQRRHYGQVPMRSLSTGAAATGGQEQTAQRSTKAQGIQKCMRVNVVRRLFLQAQQKQHTEQKVQQMQPRPSLSPGAGTRNFEMSRVLSPIAGRRGTITDLQQRGTNAVASTPNLRPPARRIGSAIQLPSSLEPKKHVSFADEHGRPMELDASVVPQLDSTTFNCDVLFDEYEDGLWNQAKDLPPKHTAYSALSQVQLIEEDYLHCMSNLFQIICHSNENL